MIEVILATSSPQLLRAGRELALHLMSGIIPGRRIFSAGGAVKASFDYEFSCWVDGVTKQTLDELITCLQESSLVSFRLVLGFAKAWQHAKLSSSVPFLPASSLLTYALQHHQASAAFAVLTCQVAAKCLLYQTNPLPLAVLIHDSHRRSLQDVEYSEVTVHLEQLAQYCSSLIHFQEIPANGKHDSLCSLFARLFSSESFSALFNGISSCSVDAGHPQGIRYANCDALILVRNLLHLIAISGPSRISATYVKALLKLTPLALSVRLRKSFVRIMELVLFTDTLWS
jgi:hypothetical protein